MSRDTRLDAADSVFFRRQLESIDARIYEKKYPKFKARGLIPTQQGVDPDARVYTYRMFDKFGKAKPISNGADDLPRAGASGAEYSQIIQNVGMSYAYELAEIRAAARTGTPLDEMRASAARGAVEELVDEYLALGNTDLGLKGLLALSNTSTYTVTGFWGDLDAADPDNVAADIMGIASKGVEATDEAFNRFTVVMPLALYNIAAQLKMSTASDVTVLKYVLATSPYIEQVVPWFRTELAGAGGTTHRIAAFPRDPECVAALVPREFTFEQPEQRNLAYVVNGTASCGGVVCRFPKAITYGDIAVS